MIEKIVWWGLVLSISLIVAVSYAGAAVADPCYSRAQARERFPNQHLYWRTAKRCWGITPPGKPLPAREQLQWYVVIPMDAADPLIPKPVQVTFPTPSEPLFLPWDSRVK